MNSSEIRKILYKLDKRNYHGQPKVPNIPLLYLSQIAPLLDRTQSMLDSALQRVGELQNFI